MHNLMYCDNYKIEGTPRVVLVSRPKDDSVKEEKPAKVVVNQTAESLID